LSSGEPCSRNRITLRPPVVRAVLACMGRHEAAAQRCAAAQELDPLA